MKKILTILAMLSIAIVGKAQPFQFVYTNVTNASCGSTADGGICWDVAYGITPYYVNITNNIDSNSAGCVSNLSANTYTITVSDFSGGVITTVVSVGINSPMVKIFASDTVLCFGDSITLSPMFKKDGIIATNNYCDLVIAGIANEDITNVTIGSLNNNSSCGDLGAQGSMAYKYQNYTDIATIITAGSSIPVSITIDECNAGVGATNSTAIFIDYNVDGDFTDSGELVYISPTSFSGAHTEVGSIDVKYGLQRGISRLRVVNATGTPNSILSCGSFVYGEVEDYTVFFETAPIQLFWQTLGGTLVDTAYSISTAQANTYTLSVDYGNGCIDTASLSVIVTDLPVVSISGTNINCPNAAIECNVLNNNGSINYAWVPTNQNTKIITNLVNGVYTCIATDSVGCKGAAVYTMTVVPQMVSLPNVTDIKCFGDSNAIINLNVTGGSVPYSYQWSANSSTAGIANNLAAGIYTASITDGNFCVLTKTITITQPSSPLATLVNATNASGFGINDGTGNVVAQGGTPPYSYLWAPTGETSAQIANKPAGTYSITVTDANGCSGFATIEISQPSNMSDIKKLYQLVLVPNPANDKIIISSVQAMHSISIVNMMGQKILSNNLNNVKQTHLDLSTISTGVYTVLINGIVAEKITINRN